MYPCFANIFVVFARHWFSEAEFLSRHCTSVTSRKGSHHRRLARLMRDAVTINFQTLYSFWVVIPEVLRGAQVQQEKSYKFREGKKRHNLREENIIDLFFCVVEVQQLCHQKSFKPRGHHSNAHVFFAEISHYLANNVSSCHSLSPSS